MSLDKVSLLIKSQELRKRFGEDDKSPLDIFSLVATDERITLVRYPMSTHFSGMCIRSDTVRLIAINSTMTLGRQRFSLAHELFHLLYDVNPTAICSTTIGSGSVIELMADQFASYLLIPPVSLQTDVACLLGKKGSVSHKISIDDIVYLEQKYGVSRQAMLVRLVEDRIITKKEAETYKTNVITSARKLGYDCSLYYPSSEESKYGTFGCLIKQADAALSKKLISAGKYEEIMLESFRPDIVYGSTEGEIID